MSLNIDADYKAIQIREELGWMDSCRDSLDEAIKAIMCLCSIVSRLETELKTLKNIETELDKRIAKLESGVTDLHNLTRSW